MHRYLLVAATAALLSVSTTMSSADPSKGDHDSYSGPVCGTLSDAQDVGKYANMHNGDGDTEFSSKQKQNLCWNILIDSPAVVMGTDMKYFDSKEGNVVELIELDILGTDGTARMLTGFFALSTISA